MIDLNLFAGSGGWETGRRALDAPVPMVGVQYDTDAGNNDDGLPVCETRDAAGLLTIRHDVEHLPVDAFAGNVRGLVTSSPCDDWSTAGPKLGLAGERGRLAWQPLRWALALRPEWCAWEQVPLVLGLWEHCARELRDAGYSVWAGQVDAADYGLPQNRKRAILVARRDGYVQPPAPTHAEHETGGLWDARKPWVTLADAIGLGPRWWYDSGQNSHRPDGTKERYVRSCDRPAGTVTSKTTSQWNLYRGDERRKLTRAESAMLQGFPADYPWRGRADQIDSQIGDAVPPPLAAHILAAASGDAWRSDSVGVAA